MPNPVSASREAGRCDWESQHRHGSICTSPANSAISLPAALDPKPLSIFHPALCEYLRSAVYQVAQVLNIQPFQKRLVPEINAIEMIIAHLMNRFVCCPVFCLSIDRTWLISSNET